MTDREKVIKGLGCCISGNTAICKRVGCPYAEEHDGIGDTCIDHLMADALALLKAQEPMEPHYTRLEYKVNGMPYVVHHPECPRCIENGLMLWDAEIEKGAAYCKRCGQAVKWK